MKEGANTNGGGGRNGGFRDYIGKMAPNYDAFSPFEHFFGPAFWGSLVSGGPILYVM
jgi:hypothetical protein